MLGSLRLICNMCMKECMMNVLVGDSQINGTLVYYKLVCV